MSVISGISGLVNGADTIRNWKVTTTAAIQKFVASNTKSMTGVLQGNKDWSGQYAAYGHSPSSMPGAALSFVGSINGSKGIAGSALVDSVEIVIDIESGAIIAHTVNFSGNGALTIGAAVATDEVLPNCFSSIGCKVQTASYAAEPSYAELTHVKTITLRFAAANPSYVDSGTGGLVKRESGNLSGSISIGLHGDTVDLTNIAAVLPNTEKFVKVFVNATDFWLLQAIRFEGLTDLVVDRETAAIIGATLNGSFSGYYAGALGAITEGTIVLPDESVWWPGT